MFYKAVITSKGLALDAKIKAGQTTAAFTRVKLGDGTYGEQEDLKGATNLKNTRNEFGISSIKVIDENTVRIRIVTNNSSLNSGYYISELALFATDPDEGEILYSISLGVPEKMDYQPSETEMFNATATIDMLTSISDAETANIQTGTGAAASAEDLAELETRIEGIETPEFDASGAVDGITGKTTLLASFVTKMPLAKFMRNVVAGFKLVLYAGQIVNNCVTDNASLPLSAAQGKVLMDLYTVLNTNFNNKQNREWIYAATLSNKNTASVGVNIRNYREACIIINGHRKSGSIMIVDDVLHFIAPEAGTGTMAFMYLVKVNIVNGGFGLYVEAANRICFLESNAWLENRNWSNSFNLYIR